MTTYKVGSLTYTNKSLRSLFLWLIWGDICYMLMEGVIPSILPLRFEKIGASNTSIGLIMTTIPGIIVAIWNPIISFRSDRYRSRWGRRIPFIVWTLPFLVMCLVGLGYADGISHWLLVNYGRALHLSARSLNIATIAVFMVGFSFFNVFVGALFWYLFNDVVPESLLARFMSLFRLVSMLTSSAYNLFVFKYADKHSTEILVGAGILYFFGFGLMALKVKEGEYPPPPKYVGDKAGLWAAIRTYAQETLSLKHYWYVFLTSIFANFSGAAGIFQIYFYQVTGLNLEQIGKVTALLSIAVGALIPFSGWLADRYHPVRIVIAGNLANVFLVGPATLLWLFWHPSPHASYIAWIILTVCLRGPTNALMGIFDPPLFMVTFPRSRYGQFCSANAMLRSIAAIIGGVLAGAFFDAAGRYMGHDNSYKMMAAWQLAFSVPGLVCVWLLYKSWKRYGGDTGYVAPIPGESAAARMAEEQREPVAV